MSPDATTKLRKAVAGLEYPSESDTPFDLLRWPRSPGTAQGQIAAHTKGGRKIVEVPIDQFFDSLKDSDDAARFQQLRKVLESTLTDLKIFRAGEGEVKVDIYLIGKLQTGDWAGLHTTSVET